MSPLPLALLAGVAAALAMPVRRAPSFDAGGADVVPADERGWLARYRILWCALAALGADVFVGGTAGLVVAPFAGGGCWLLISRSEPTADRHRRAAAARDLPQVVRLLGIALEAGAAPTEALAVVTDAVVAGAGNDIAARLDGVLARLRLGADPPDAWAMLAADPVLAPLGRALGRAHESGASVAVSVRRLADELTALERADAEERARAVGVKAAVPLGICLMPSFLLIGVVPLVGGLVSGLTW